MAGRFPLYTDADVRGPVVNALRRAGWDVVRAIDLYPEGTDDDIHFAHAAREGRVMIVHDMDQVVYANDRLAKQLPCPPLIVWPQKSYIKAPWPSSRPSRTWPAASSPSIPTTRSPTSPSGADALHRDAPRSEARLIGSTAGLWRWPCLLADEPPPPSTNSRSAEALASLGA